MSKFLFLLNIIAVIALFWAYMSPYISPDISSFFSVFGLLFPFILILNLAFVVFWLIAKPKYSWLGIVALVMGYAPISKLIKLSPPDLEKHEFEILSYNLGGNQLLIANTAKGSKEKVAKFESFIASIEDVDILCFQELGLKTQKKMDEVFSGYYSVDDEYRGTKVYSKYPIIDSGNIKLESLSHNAAWVDLHRAEKDTIRVYSIHLSSNRISATTDHMLDSPSINDEELWSDINFVLGKYAHHAKLRKKQIQTVLDHASHSRYPVIICGDFNDVPQSNIYRTVTKKYNDSFKSGGFGLGSTYRMNIPFLRIDYIFHDSEFECVKHKTLKTKFSDHYPIIGLMRKHNKY